MTEWIYKGAEFDADDELNGRNPYQLMLLWSPWVASYQRMADSFGAYRAYPITGGLYEQPAIDMEIFDIIKARWCELRNAEMKKSLGGKHG